MKNNDDISEEYLLLFNTITDTEKELSELSKRLIVAQQRAEEMYIMAGCEHNHNLKNIFILHRARFKSPIKKLHSIRDVYLRQLLCAHCQISSTCHS